MQSRTLQNILLFVSVFWASVAWAETIAIIGRVCGVAIKGDGAANRLKTRMDRVLAKVMGRDRPLVFLQINIKPIMTVNRNTFHHDLIHLAGEGSEIPERPIVHKSH